MSVQSTNNPQVLNEPVKTKRLRWVSRRQCAMSAFITPPQEPVGVVALQEA